MFVNRMHQKKCAYLFYGIKIRLHASATQLQGSKSLILCGFSCIPLYKNWPCYFIKYSIVRLKHFGNQVYNTLWCVELSFTFSFCKSELTKEILIYTAYNVVLFILCIDTIDFIKQRSQLFVNCTNNGTGNKSSSIKKVRIFVFIK